ncbi:oligosaccharide flippase family protein [Tenacibaculum sp. UWU-22]|uniref:oligosaccharide flippase family protein n=1 Tax=Tenacibaculum sp. UWU-22 TaxID=3234187 RepID=UPI0034DB2BE7
MRTIFKSISKKITHEHLFMISVLIVNGGNYLYNLVLGRFLGPEKFSDAAILITFLLVLSFVAMTFQLVTAKFSVEFDATTLKKFISNTYVSAFVVGLVLGVLIVFFSTQLQAFFKTSTATMFVIFGLGIPFYFVMSVNRGIFQGKKRFIPLSITYQLEMISRLLFTLLLFFVLMIDTSIIVAIGIFLSFVIAMFPNRLQKVSFKKIEPLTKEQSSKVRTFFMISAFYELTQIVINNSDIILVKHYFENYDAGLYASLALIGRVVYFIAWMFVMLLLPTVLKLKKEGKNTTKILSKYVVYITLITGIIVVSCFFFPKQIILILFGKSYLSIGSLLWQYALAIGFFAISNIFAYYYLLLDKYIPVIISGVFGLLQILLIVLFHNSLAQVVHMQIIAMVTLLVIQSSFFYFKTSFHKKHI